MKDWKMQINNKWFHLGCMYTFAQYLHVFSLGILGKYFENGYLKALSQNLRNVSSIEKVEYSNANPRDCKTFAN